MTWPAWLTGRTPKLFGDFVTAGYLPQARAERCQLEYARAANAFAVLFGPYIDLKVAAKQPKRWLAPPSPLPKRGGTPGSREPTGSARGYS